LRPARARRRSAQLRNGAPEDAYFTGINAATLSLLTGEAERAAALAREVRALCLGELEHPSKDASYWLHATLAEAALLLGERTEAQEHYGRAAERAGVRYADLSTTRRQARLLLAQRGEDAGWVEELLRVPSIVMFTGHMIDGPDRKTPRFPPELEGAASRAIRDRLRHLRPAAGYASAACGGDILFLEALLEDEREFHVVLPFPPAEFLRASVDLVPGSDWPQRFDRILEAAASVTSASDHASEDPSSFVYANLILSGMAALHARRLETELLGLAVWDGKPAAGPGGTASLIEHWQSRGLTLEHIDLGILADGGKAAARRAEPETPPPVGKDVTDEARDELMAMLFADAVGYSRLNEDQTRLFVAHFLSPIAELIEASPHPPVLRETAGDGFYFVFEHAGEAGLFAVALQDLVARLDWEARGLPATLGLRVALHCGPVQKLIDPITGLTKYTGPHTSRTARIEPITPPGQVYASQAFAAVAAATGVEELAFEYVGRTALAKKYGSLPLYHVRRA
jgi:class 3 adenylate cyclase